ncbi:adenine deaminase C-terminal domain-containing protein [Evansella cellulosilytica]|uniref:adenine deaminase n=1 Tax=Evansella cellulosilytica (strain ATCC 21833 / DSM 2522 / FERM P-1141 / JCM 9156 / N-4) TaxID=649639 RepID=E6TWM6_EVAC2|nr:adenine deaminase C-terminal domain-containing protein [Evansella cellulosilytica]ADU28709.1 Adenine deaminase [Evansella cellulosilytica DSM 2522]
MVKGFSHYWTKREIRQQLEVIRGNLAPTKVITNAKWLNSVRKCWNKGNIWIYNDRIVYVGDQLPKLMPHETEIFDASSKYAVPGYIEHHAHPFQLYNPLSLAQYASERGTTTLINDNLLFFLHLSKKKALTLLDNLQKTPATLLWWARYDSQTELHNEEEVFAYSNMRTWINHPYVVQGGELTGWPSVLNGDDSILHWMQETKDVKKPIEGHFPGASEKTLTQMALLGVDGDHESMTGEDVIRRLDMGMTASLRYSSIRPDLPNLLSELHEAGLDQYESLLMTTDGSTPSFMKNGMMEHLIKIALDNGVPFMDAIAMCTYNVAKHYHMDDMLGMIAPGRIANINFLSSTEDPLPTDVLAKGQWVRKQDTPCFPNIDMSWNEYDLSPLNIDWDLQESDFHFSLPVGVEMANDVILKPYRIISDLTRETLSEENDECFFILVDRSGKWILSTAIKGFGKSLYGFASTFNHTGDIILIGKSKQGLLKAFDQLKKQQGGIVLLDEDKMVFSMNLPLNGMMSEETMEKVMEQEATLKEALKGRGYRFNDPIYSLLFFASTHLPYVRVTQKGIFDVKKKKVLFPSIMR